MPQSTSLPRRFIIARELGIELPERFRLDTRPWQVVVTSRLGRDLLRRRAAIASMHRFIGEAFARGEWPLIVANTAAQPWANRSCQLHGVEPARVISGSERPKHRTENPLEPLVAPVDWCRDRLAIELADRVDVAHVRRGGTMHKWLLQRLSADAAGNAAGATSVQVLVQDDPESASADLLATGAVGRGVDCGDDEPPFTPASSTQSDPARREVQAAAIRSLLDSPDQWLVHSTRARTGPWPDESTVRFNDWLLQSPLRNLQTSPLETLQRIIDQRRLIGTDRTIRGCDAVVCFTELPIREWLARRTYRPQLGRWDAEPYGIAIARPRAIKLGALPVIYRDSMKDSTSETEPTAEVSQRWRYQSRGTTYDWTEEREWRIRGDVDLTRFGEDEVIVFLRDFEQTSHLKRCPWPIVAMNAVGDD